VFCNSVKSVLRSDKGEIDAGRQSNDDAKCNKGKNDFALKNFNIRVRKQLTKCKWDMFKKVTSLVELSQSFSIKLLNLCLNRHQFLSAKKKSRMLCNQTNKNIW